MLDFVNPGGSVIFNGDDDKLSAYVPENGTRPVYFGLGENCSFRAENIVNRGLKGTDAEFVTPVSRFSAHINIPGSHMVHSALAGIAVGYALGMNDTQIAAGIQANVPIAGRNNLIETKDFMIIDDCYNANPVSTKASLDVLACADTRTVAILGDMFELGEKEKEMHYEVGRHAAEDQIDVLVCIGGLSQETARGAEEAASENTDAGIQVCRYETKADFYLDMKKILQGGDTILVKASHGMEFSEIIEKLQNF